MDKANVEHLSQTEKKLKNQYKHIRGILVLHKNEWIYERYFDGYKSEDRHHVASVTKSVMSALVGIAIDKGYIKSVQQKVVDFFPEYKIHPANIQKKEITIEHILHMVAPYSFVSGKEPLGRLCRQRDWIYYTLDTLGKGGKIGEFKYSTSGAHLLSAILTQSTDRSARDFANEFLFRPIGIEEIPDYPMESYTMEYTFGSKMRGWIKDPKGHSIGGWGMLMSLREMARFGSLYLHEGMWEDKRIISPSWIKDSITKNTNDYGYLWWLFEEEDFSMYAAMGDGGNVICCIPEKEMVISVVAQTMKSVGNPKQYLKRLVEFALDQI